MSLRFLSLGSGSRGNATLVWGNGTLLLIDCGYPLKELRRRCALAGVDPCDIDALFVTHEHGDHTAGVGAVARALKVPVWMSHGTWHARDFGELPELHLFNSHDASVRIGGLRIQPVPVPHDAREPVQFVVEGAGRRLGLLTDLGSFTRHVASCYRDLDGLLLECNHDLQMLAEGPYPPRLQARVGGDYGHLNNGQAGALLREIGHARLQHLVAGHLSEKNNRPELARGALCRAVPEIESRLSLLQQDTVSGWFAIE
ncbi:MAG: MBL fold metallo-hydrolase [Gammaproteobacteria bacterium]|nr:MAG: MBL fold metallo-hydrolase [Gammaproteobacteria bacterium]